MTATFRVADTGYAFHFEDEALGREVCAAWAPFAGQGEDVRVHVIGGVERAPAGGQQGVPVPRADSGGALRYDEPTFEARISRDEAALALRPGADRGAVDFVLRTLIAMRALLVHAVAVGDARGVALFPAPSGGGKSTLGRLCSGGLVADELVAVTAGPVAHATPWHHSSLPRAPIVRLGLLAFGPDALMTDAPKSEVLRTLVDNIYLPHPTPDARREAFTAASKLVEALPCGRLFFRPDDTAAAAVRAWLDFR